MSRSDLRWIGWRRAAVLLAGLTVLGALGGFAVAKIRGPLYQATVTVLVQSSPSAVVSLLLNGAAPDVGADDQMDVAGLATSQVVLASVAGTLGGGLSWSDLGPVVSGEPVQSSHMVLVKASDPDPARAERIAELDATALAGYQQQQAKNAMKDLPAGVNGTPSDIQQRAAVLAANLQPVKVVGGTFVTNTRPVATLVAALAVVGLAAGALLVSGLGMRRRVPRPPTPVGDNGDTDTGLDVVMLPSVRFDAAAPAAGTVRLVGEMVPGWPARALLVVPVDERSAPAAEQVAAVLRRGCVPQPLSARGRSASSRGLVHPTAPWRDLEAIGRPGTVGVGAVRPDSKGVVVFDGGTADLDAWSGVVAVRKQHRDDLPIGRALAALPVDRPVDVLVLVP